jgi:hypothetical protein
MLRLPQDSPSGYETTVAVVAQLTQRSRDEKRLDSGLNQA